MKSAEENIMIAKVETFVSPTKGQMTLEGVVQDVVAFMSEEPKNHYALVIGTDSHAEFGAGNGGQLINFVCAVIIHRTGFGGRYFWKRTQTRKVHTLREKIHRETLLSIELAREFLDKLQPFLYGQRNYDLEIHLDVGATGATRELVREVVGMVQGSGFRAKTKPASYGAFIIADKHT